MSVRQWPAGLKIRRGLGLLCVWALCVAGMAGYARSSFALSAAGQALELLLWLVVVAALLTGGTLLLWGLFARD